MIFHEAAARALAGHGVTHVFGVLGDANLYMMDSFERTAGGRFVAVANEGGGVLAANGYARTSGEIGVATVTHGPALTNTVTALVESTRDRTPLLLLAGDTSAIDREGLQSIPQRDVVLATGAGFEQVRAPITLFEDLSMAVHRAVTEKRPVVVNIPVEFQWAEIDYAPSSARVPPVQPAHANPAALDVALGVIASARRPVVLAGRGAADATARDALLRLATRIGAPVATSLRAKDLFRGHPYNLGVCGTLSHPVALDVLNRSDCVIAFGAGLNKWTTAEGSFLSKKRVVHVDLDWRNINRWAQVNAGVVGDAAAVADSFISMLDEIDATPTEFASPAMAADIASYDPTAHVDTSTASTIDIRTAVTRLDSAFPPDRTLVFDFGRWAGNSFIDLHVQEPSAYVHTANFGSIGLGMGNAIGAAFGAPGRPVLLVTGDGGFMLGGLMEFNSAVRHKIDLVVVLFNDGAYGAEHIQFRNRDMDPSISTFAWPEFGPVATALGGEGHTVRNLAELDSAFATIEQRTKPMLIDVKLDPDRVPMRRSRH